MTRIDWTGRLPVGEQDTSWLDSLEPGTVTLTGFWDVATEPQVYTFGWDDLHPESQRMLLAMATYYRTRRLSRMHSAYHRRKR